MRKPWHPLTLLVITVPGVCLGQSIEQQSQDGGGSFVDRFARLDTKRWYISDGWSNSPHQNCTWQKANIQVDGSAELTLSDRAGANRPFSCAEMQSTAYFGYGTYEVRMRAAPGPGTVSAFFTFVGPPHGRPHNEIDFEFLGKDRNSVFLNYFVDGAKHERTIKFDHDATASSQDYAFEWLPNSLRWFVNGRLVREATKDRGDLIPGHMQKIYLSIWNGVGWDQEAWLGRFEYPGHPLVATYEWVAFTRMGESCQFPSSIVCTLSGASGRIP